MCLPPLNVPSQLPPPFLCTQHNTLHESPSAMNDQEVYSQIQQVRSSPQPRATAPSRGACAECLPRSRPDPRSTPPWHTP